jgi:hypothetical protein
MPGRKPIGTGGPRREIDQDALVTRYTRAGWSMARCGRAFGISTNQVRRVLLTRGVPLRGAPELDEAAIVAAYQRHHSVSYLANALGKEDRVIKAVLAAHGVDIQRPPRPSLGKKLSADTT